MAAADPGSMRGPAKIFEHLDQLTFPTEHALTEDQGGMSLLIVRTHGDEVWWLLRVGKAVGGFFRWLWESINRVGGWIAWVLIVSIGVRMLIEELDLPIDLEVLQDPMSIIDRFVMTPLLLFASSVLVVIVIMRWFFSLDAIKWVPSVDTWTGDVPWLDATSQIAPKRVSPDDTAKGLLRHTRIQSSAAPVIAAWIAKSG